MLPSVALRIVISRELEVPTAAYLLFLHPRFRKSSEVYGCRICFATFGSALACCSSIRGLTLTILLTLALGVGANTAIFTVDYATLLEPLPYPQPDQLMVVWSKIQSYHNGISAGDFTDWKRENTSISGFECVDGRRVQPGDEGPAGTDRWAHDDAGLLSHAGHAILSGAGFSAGRGPDRAAIMR